MSDELFRLIAGFRVTQTIHVAVDLGLPDLLAAGPRRMRRSSPPTTSGRFGTIVDVGGGDGALLASILEAHPSSRGILFDQEHVVSRAEPVLRGRVSSTAVRSSPGASSSRCPTRATRMS